MITNFNLSTLGLSRAQIIQTPVDEIIERTIITLEPKLQSLSQYQINQLRYKIIEAKKLIEF